MTYYVNLRAGPYGAVCEPYVLEGDGTADPVAMTSVFANAVPIIAKGKDVLVAVHGFNVSYQDGVRSFAHLEAAMDMRATELFLGVLWPGDWVIPAVNYPFEDRIASHGGALLGAFCNRWLASARSVSFLSHSLGARVVLQAIKAATIPVRRACITAGAVNADCLKSEYAAAAMKCSEIRTLSSMMDVVLEFAYPPGDLLADLLDPDHKPFEPALGRGGPVQPLGPTVRNIEIPDRLAFDHGDYFPPAAPMLPPASARDKWRHAAAFMASVFRGQAPVWP